MAQFPSLLTGPITATTLSQMIPQTVRKTTSTARASTTTVSADPELTGISLGVGVWEVRALLFTFHTSSGTTTANFKLRWSFTGTASGTRACLGLSAGTTTTTASTMRNIGSALTTEQSYGVTDTFMHPLREDAIVVVTVPGSLSLDWAQGTSNANAVNLGVNSTVWWRRIE